jgi:hypothetical protein
MEAWWRHEVPMSTPRICAVCGGDCDRPEGFQFLRAINVGLRLQEMGEKRVLCHVCAEALLRSGGFEVDNVFCDQCGSPVELEHVAIRTRTETTQLGSVASHSSVGMSLCPKCASAYDGTGRSLFIGIYILLGGVVLLFFLGWLIG